MNKQELIVSEVLDELARAMKKFPTWPCDPLHAVAVLGEEFGELTKAVLQTVYEPHKVKTGELRTEAVQTAAMALRFLASLDSYSILRSPQHEQAPELAEKMAKVVGINKRHRVYISGPMSGLPDHNFPAFHAESARLRALGFEVVNPAELNPEPGKAWKECLKVDLLALLSCDWIAMLPGWQSSEGAHLEMHVAHRVGIAIVDAHMLGGKAAGYTPTSTPLAMEEA